MKEKIPSGSTDLTALLESVSSGLSFKHTATKRLTPDDGTAAWAEISVVAMEPLALKHIAEIVKCSGECSRLGVAVSTSLDMTEEAEAAWQEFRPAAVVG